MTPAWVDLLTRALGPPVCTPEWLLGPNGKLVRARYRVFRWRCPVCGGGWNDPDLIWRPLVADSDGRVSCGAAGCSARAIGVEARGLLDAQTILDSLQAKEAA